MAGGCDEINFNLELGDAERAEPRASGRPQDQSLVTVLSRVSNYVYVIVPLSLYVLRSLVVLFFNL